MKIRIIDPAGVVFGGKTIPQGTTLDIAKGPHTNAWLRFKQAEEITKQTGKARKAAAAETATPATDAAATEGAGKKADKK